MKCFSSFFSFLWSQNICSINHLVRFSKYVFFSLLYYLAFFNFLFFSNASLLMDVVMLVYILFQSTYLNIFTSMNLSLQVSIYLFSYLFIFSAINLSLQISIYLFLGRSYFVLLIVIDTLSHLIIGNNILFVCLSVCMYVCMNVYMSLYMYMSLYLYVCLYVCMYYVCMYVCLYDCMSVCLSVLCLYVCTSACTSVSLSLWLYVNRQYVSLSAFCVSFCLSVCIMSVCLTMNVHLYVCVHIFPSVCIYLTFIYEYYYHQFFRQESAPDLRPHSNHSYSRYANYPSQVLTLNHKKDK